MSDWIKVAAIADLLPGEHKVVEAAEVDIAVFNIDGNYYAIEDVCSHDGSELTGGGMDGYEIICPRHGARFDVRSGMALTPPAYEPTATFPVKIEDETVYTRDDRDD
ncbi:MAG: non-heme iron oxygenase ferredoxin subunit [Gammaproteobacteria bacterium]|jgi:3-phenylpropionate/trans-cinnamate dioxygenase ferredoxin subunit|nr:non-heme iron oxygenase ferredoxin subunit [Gammaproteobacteria bacterium]